MKKLLRVGLFVILGLLLLVGAGYVWASRATAQSFARSIDAHEVDFPIPFPLDQAGAEADGEVMMVSADVAVPMNGADAAGAGSPSAAEAAVERGRHLVSARYGCTDCHGADFSGGVMMDAMPVARAFGPNLTLGEGSVTRDYTPSDWDRAVRHGIGSDGRPLVMPSLEFQFMSDQELSDVVSYIRTMPPVDNQTPPVEMGPIGKMLVARGVFQLSADQIPSHDAPHELRPPPAVADVTFGRHLASPCMGCHKTDFTGGDIGGDPSWAPAANLTTGNIDAWTLQEFMAVMREGVRPDGTALLEPMTFILRMGQSMTDVELEAIYLFLQSLPTKEAAD